MLMALADIAHIASLPCQRIGVHAYVVRNHFPSRFRPATLDRIERVRLSSTPVPSNINWTAGKGVVGLCWQQQRDIAMDLDALHGPHVGCDASIWATLGHDVTLGLSFQEFKRTTGKYGFVVATPLARPSGEVVGVIAADGPCGESSALDTGPVKDVLRRLADDIQRHLNK